MPNLPPPPPVSVTRPASIRRPQPPVEEVELEGEESDDDYVNPDYYEDNPVLTVERHYKEYVDSRGLALHPEANQLRRATKAADYHLAKGLRPAYLIDKTWFYATPYNLVRCGKKTLIKNEVFLSPM